MPVAATRAAHLPRVVSLEDARRRGLHDRQVQRRVRAGRWVALCPGVFCTAPPVLGDDVVTAAAHHAGPRGMLTSTTALRVYGFRAGLVPAEPTPLVLVPYAGGIRSTPRVRVRRAVHLPERVSVDGLPLAPVARAVADRAAQLRRLDDVRALVAEAVQRNRCSVEQLQRELHHVARRGSAHLRQAVGEVADGARSAPEARAAAVLRTVPLPTWRQDVEILARNERFVVDFYVEELRAVIEMDGEEYHRYREGWARTMDRDTALQIAGYAVLHLRPSDAASPGVLLDKVVPWLRTRAAALGIPWRWT